MKKQKPTETTTMTDAQIEKAIRLFKQALRERPDLFEITGADPTIQNCYTSSSSVNGVFFPNSSVTLYKTADGDDYSAYDVVCVSKDEKNQYHFVLSRNDDKLNEFVRKHFTKERLEEIYPEYASVPLDMVITTYEERQIRMEVSDRLKNYRQQLDALSNLTFSAKKDGAPFSRLSANFTNAFIRFNKDWGGNVSNIQVWATPTNGQYPNVKITIYLSDENRYHQEGYFTFGLMMDLIDAEKASIEKNIADYQAELDYLHVGFRKSIELAMKFKKGLEAAIPEAFRKTIAFHEIMESVKIQLR